MIISTSSSPKEKKFDGSLKSNKKCILLLDIRLPGIGLTVENFKNYVKVCNHHSMKSDKIKHHYAESFSSFNSKIEIMRLP